MALVKRKSLRKDNRGGAFLEFTVVVGVLLVVLFGMIEFMFAYYQWNAATKAVQVGVRLAATSNPVWSAITGLTGLENNTLIPGSLLNPGNYDYKVTCSGDTTSCVINTAPPGGAANTYDATAMDTLVFGRPSQLGPAGLDCNDPPGTYFGMCDVFKRITPANVRIIYQQTGAGYATRPGGLVPTITVQIIGLNFQFIALDDLLGLDPIPIPNLTSTLIAEDMRSGAPTF